MFFSCGNGSVVEFILIHQGPDGGVAQSSILEGDEMQGDVFFKYLSTSWLVRHCVSGYMTKSIWRDTANLIIHLINSLPRRRPYMLYIDGYGAHWDHKALTILVESGIYVTFLRSQNSKNEQFNDNGPNGRLKAIYADEMAKFTAEDSTRRVQWFQTPRFNLIFQRTWAIFAGGIAHRLLALLSKKLVFSC